MKFLLAVFVSMALYGLVTDHKGAGLLALFMAGFVVYGERQLNKRDAEFAASPQSANVEPESVRSMHEHCCEAARSTF